MRTFYDPLEHAYYINDRRVVSVTQALTLSGKVNAQWFTEAARNRGLAVHDMCERIDRRLPLVEMADDVGAPVEAYRAFLHDHRPRWRYIEHGLFHKTDAYGGRPDRAGMVPLAGKATVELKTGAEEEWHGLQLAGYQGLLPTGARFVLYLGKNGKYKFVRCKRAADYPEFRECLLNARALLEGGGVPI